MRNLLGIIIVLIFFASSSYGQYQTVILSYEKSYFGENQPLPAEKYFIINGSIREDVQYVEVQIFSKRDKPNRTPLYTNFWKRNFDNAAPVFNLPVNYKLKEGNDYDILINFYRTISEKERANLSADIFNTLSAYVDQSVNMSSRKIKIGSNHSQVISDLDQIVERGMYLYRSRTLATFPGYSDMIKLKLKQIDGVKLKKADNIGISSDGNLSAEAILRNQLIAELKELLYKEVSPYLNAEIFVLLDDKFIDNYPVEKLKDAFYLSPHFGYGGVAFNTNPDEFSYGSNMFVGLSFPLSRKSNSEFLNNTSVTLGAFLGNFEDEDGNEISGPLFKIPTYVGLGYRPFAFFRIQAGAAFLEDASTSGTVSGFTNRVEVRPFIGVSAELNVWLNTNKK